MGQCISYFYILIACKCKDIPGIGRVYRLAIQPVERKQFGSLSFLFLFAFSVKQNDLLIGLNRALLYTADRDTSHIVVPIHAAHQHFERCFCILLGWRNMIHNQIEERRQILSFLFQILFCDSIDTYSIQNREVQLFIIGIERYKQIKNHVQNLIRPCILAVNFIDENDGPVSQSQRFSKYKLGLWKRAFCSVHQQNHPVYHFQNPFHLASKISVTRRVHNIDFGIIPDYGRVL